MDLMQELLFKLGIKVLAATKVVLRLVVFRMTTSFHLALLDHDFWPIVGSPNSRLVLEDRRPSPSIL